MYVYCLQAAGQFQLITIIIIVVVVTTFMKDIYIYVSEANHVHAVYSVAAVL
jgi:hypothetical protein